MHLARSHPEAGTVGFAANLAVIIDVLKAVILAGLIEGFRLWLRRFIHHGAGLILNLKKVQNMDIQTVAARWQEILA